MATKKKKQEAEVTLIGEVEERLGSCIKAKGARMEEALTVLLAYSGYSIERAREYAMNVTTHSGSLPRWFEDRVVLNVMQPIARTSAAIITANNPQWLVHPAGDTAHKRQAARGVQKLLEWFYRTNEMSAILDDVVLRSVLMGYAGIYVDWDSVIGVGDVRDANHGRDGWFVVEPVDVFNWHHEPGVGSESKAHWAVKETTMHIEEARLYFNNPNIEPPKVTKDDTDTLQRHIQLVREFDANVGDSEIEDRVRVITYYQKPGYTFRDGYEVTIAGDAVVDSRESLLLGEFPVYAMNYVLEPHREYGAGMGSALLQLQRDISVTWNGYRARRDQEVMPPWLVPKGSVGRGINTRPRAINEYNPRAGKPEQLRFDPMSQVVGGFGDKTLTAMEYVAGINDASRGETPTSNATGRLTAFLAELDNRRLGPTVRSTVGMLKRVGTRMVRLWQEFGSETVTVTVFGGVHASEIAEVRRKDLIFNDIEVDVASMMPRQQPMRQETILNLLQMGVIERDKALEALEFGGFDEAVGIKSVEALNARHENSLLADLGTDEEEVSVLEYEDHDTHLKEHINYVLLEQPGIAIRKRFEEHIQGHKSVLEQRQQAAMQAEMAAKGGGPPGAPGGATPGEAIPGSMAQPGGLPPGMIDLQEPGVDKRAEAELASMAGLE